MEFDFDKAIVEEMQYLNIRVKKYSSLSEEDQQDLVSETIFKAYRYKNQFKFENKLKFRGWLVRIMETLFINITRKEQVYTQVHFDNPELITLVESMNVTECTDSDLLREEEFKVVDEFLKDPINRKLAYGFSQGYKYQELSEILELPMGTVKSKIFILRNKLKRLKDHYEGSRGRIGS